MNRTRTRRRAPRPRRGLTLIELIVAVTILMLGLLGIVGVSASVARSLGHSRNASLAAELAQSRFEKISGTSCSAFTLGQVNAETTRGITERWVVTDGGNFTRNLYDTLTWNVPRPGATNTQTTRRATFQTLITCRPGS